MQILQLQGLDIHVSFCAIFCATSAKEDNFCDFLFAFLHTKSLLKGAYSKRKNLLLKGANSFLLEKTPFQKGTKSI